MICIASNSSILMLVWQQYDECSTYYIQTRDYFYKEHTFQYGTQFVVPTQTCTKLPIKLCVDDGQISLLRHVLQFFQHHPQKRSSSFKSLRSILFHLNPKNKTCSVWMAHNAAFFWYSSWTPLTLTCVYTFSMSCYDCAIFTLLPWRRGIRFSGPPYVQIFGHTDKLMISHHFQPD